MAKFVEIEEIMKDRIIEVMPNDFYRDIFSSVKGVRPPYEKRRVLIKKTIIDIDSIVCIEPTRFECENMEDPIIPAEYCVYFSKNLYLFITADEYNKKLKNLLFSKDISNISDNGDYVRI